MAEEYFAACLLEGALREVLSGGLDDRELGGADGEAAWREGRRYVPRLVGLEAGCMALPVGSSWRLGWPAAGNAAAGRVQRALVATAVAEEGAAALSGPMLRLAVQAAEVLVGDVLEWLGLAAVARGGGGRMRGCAGLVAGVGAAVRGAMVGQEVLGLAATPLCSSLPISGQGGAPLPPLTPVG